MSKSANKEGKEGWEEGKEGKEGITFHVLRFTPYASRITFHVSRFTPYASRLLNAHRTKLQFRLLGERVESGIGDVIHIGFRVEEVTPMEGHKE